MVPAVWDFFFFFFFWFLRNKVSIMNRKFLPEGYRETTLWIINTVSKQRNPPSFCISPWITRPSILMIRKFQRVPHPQRTNIILSIAEKALLFVRLSDLRTDCGENLRAQEQRQLILFRILSCSYPGIDLQWTKNYVCWLCRGECWFFCN